MWSSIRLEDRLKIDQQDFLHYNTDFGFYSSYCRKQLKNQARELHALTCTLKMGYRLLCEKKKWTYSGQEGNGKSINSWKMVFFIGMIIMKMERFCFQ